MDMIIFSISTILWGIGFNITPKIPQEIFIGYEFIIVF
jgi:hypothetical protein